MAMRDDVTRWSLDDVERFELDSRIMSGTYEIGVALPLSYVTSDRYYPVLIVTDASMCFPTAVDAVRMQCLTGELQELIVVGVGIPRSEGLASFSLRRLHDLTPGVPDMDRDHPVVRLLRERFEAAGLNAAKALGGAPQFLDCLAYELLPILQRDYRIDPGNVGLFGHSAGGAFASYAILKSSPLFNSYICGSFATDWYAGTLPSLEEEFMARHDGRGVRVFYGFGGAELDDPAVAGVVSGRQLLARLAQRRLPGLRIATRMFDDENHTSVLPHVLSSGIRWLWASGMTWGEAARSRS